MARKMKSGQQDVVGETCIKDDDGRVVYDEEKISGAWKLHFERLLNEEFVWDRENLSPVECVEGPAPWFGSEMAREAIKKTKDGKAAGKSGIVAEMLKASGGFGINMVVGACSFRAHSKHLKDSHREGCRVSRRQKSEEG